VAVVEQGTEEARLMKLYLVANPRTPVVVPNLLFTNLRSAIKAKNVMGSDYAILELATRVVEPDEDGRYRIGM
jgi:hypothetical protein